jgi:hypothetical protein
VAWRADQGATQRNSGCQLPHEPPHDQLADVPQLPSAGYAQHLPQHQSSYKRRLIAAFMRTQGDILNVAQHYSASGALRRRPQVVSNPRRIRLLARENDAGQPWRSSFRRAKPQIATDRSKGKGRREAGPIPTYNRIRRDYPFVTTGGGGGALPLPTWALAATLRRASTAAVARASFFMRQTLHFATTA